MPLTTSQKQDIICVERIASAFSLIGAAFVIITFALSDRFRKPVNRLVVYATFGNILTNVATLISSAGIESGPASSLCQFQGFLLQWFLLADAFWILAMACNVWLSFFRSYDTAALKRLEKFYALACYGIPMIPAFTFLFVNTQRRGKVYGPALLWCWVSIKWDFLRVATFYGPVWIVILGTMAIYIRVGTVILKWRKQLLLMGKDHYTDDGLPATGIMKTSEVIVSGEAMSVRKVQAPDLIKDSSYSGRSNRQTLPHRPQVPRVSGGVDPNKATIKYCKCAMLFFFALIITWVPSTINRIYTIVRPDEVIFGLNLTAALVLPLQGFWNAIVYMSTSSFAVKCMWNDIIDVCRISPSHGLLRRLRRQGQSLQSSEMDEVSLKVTEDLHDDPERAVSQRGLVGLAR